MFTVKLYRGGQLSRICDGDYITFDESELPGSTYGDVTTIITAHRKDSVEMYFVGPQEAASPENQQFVYDRAIIENDAGKTTEIINYVRRHRAQAVRS